MWEPIEGMWRRTLIAGIVGIPALLLVFRLIVGRTVGYGWGWQMFS